MNEVVDYRIIEQIKTLLESARQRVASEVNLTYL